MEGRKIEIDIMSNPKDFVEQWSPHYDYPNSNLYNDNIKTGLSNKDSFIELFRWKNGIRNIADKKMKVIEGFWEKVNELNKLKTGDDWKKFDWKRFEDAFEPHKSSCIWKMFLLHIMDAKNYPIFDVHVYRFHYFLTTGTIKEIPSYQKSKYEYYRDNYIGWFNNMKVVHELDPKEMDKAFFTFGKILKPLKGVPINIS